jgi:hypothetical protein
MAEYRAFPVGADGHLIKRYDFHAPNDAAALLHARQWLDGKDIEVWQLSRVVGKLMHDGPREE